MSLQNLKIGSLLIAFALLTFGVSAQSAERLFQAALYQEEVEGELTSAIELYQEILEQFPDERSIGAKAQLHIGICFEKLGHERAREAYERVVLDFADQPDTVAMARNRLAEIDRAVSSNKREPNFRKIQIPGSPENAVFSPEGEQLAFFADGGLWIVPVRGNVSPDIAGEPTRIADVPGGWALGNLLSWSVNGEWIAVNSGSAGENTVYVVPAGGGEPRVVPVPPRGGHAQSYRMSLSPDGEQLAFSALELESQESDRLVDRYIYTVPTGGGSPQRLTFNWSRLPAYSPDGKYIAYVGYRERKIWSEDSKRSRYHGDLWIVPSAGGTPIRLKSAEGRLRGPVWSPDGRWIAFIIKESPESDSAEIFILPSEGGEARPVGSPGHDVDFGAIAFSPDGKQIAFFSDQSIKAMPIQGGSTEVLVREIKYRGRSEMAFSPSGDRIAFTTGSQNVGDAKIRVVQLETGRLTELQTGLPADAMYHGFSWSPDGDKIAFVASIGGKNEFWLISDFLPK
jgi:Tol biopolymer transport system component